MFRIAIVHLNDLPNILLCFKKTADNSILMDLSVLGLNHISLAVSDVRGREWDF
jgi:hypothetical protein